MNSVDKKTSQFKSRLNFQACKSICPLTRLAHLRNLCLYCQSSCDVGQRSCQVCKTSRIISGVISLSLVFFCLCHLCVFCNLLTSWRCYTSDTFRLLLWLLCNQGQQIKLTCQDLDKREVWAVWDEAGLIGPPSRQRSLNVATATLSCMITWIHRFFCFRNQKQSLFLFFACFRRRSVLKTKKDSLYLYQ